MRLEHGISALKTEVPEKALALSIGGHSEETSVNKKEGSHQTPSLPAS